VQAATAWEHMATMLYTVLHTLLHTVMHTALHTATVEPQLYYTKGCCCSELCIQLLQ
jgi:hypothetical protein